MNLRTVLFFLIYVILLAGFALVLFWYFGIFKKEYLEQATEIQQVSQIATYMKTYDYKGLKDNVIDKLPDVELQIPPITPEELGKEKLF